MSARAAKRQADVDPEAFAALRRMAEEMSGRRGVGKVEIAGGAVVAMLPPVNRHEHAVSKLWRQLDAQVAATHPGYVAFAGAGIEDLARGMFRRPDVLVFPEVALEGTGSALHPHEVVLVIEVVSCANPLNDYRDKAADYAAMGIPHYVLVFGDTVAVGPWRLDTSVLLTYGPPGREKPLAGVPGGLVGCGHGKW